MFLWYSLPCDSANLSAYGYPSWLDTASQETKLNKNIITLHLPYPFMFRTFKAWRISTGVFLSCFSTHWLRGVICWGMELSQGKSLPWKVDLFWIPLSKNTHQTDEKSYLHLFGNWQLSATVVSFPPVMFLDLLHIYISLVQTRSTQLKVLFITGTVSEQSYGASSWE